MLKINTPTWTRGAAKLDQPWLYGLRNRGKLLNRCQLLSPWAAPDVCHGNRDAALVRTASLRSRPCARLCHVVQGVKVCGAVLSLCWKCVCRRESLEGKRRSFVSCCRLSKKRRFFFGPHTLSKTRLRVGPAEGQLHSLVCPFAGPGVLTHWCTHCRTWCTHLLVYPLQNLKCPLQDLVYPLQNLVYPQQNLMYKLQNLMYPSSIESLALCVELTVV